MVATTYGLKEIGFSKFVIVAPHAAGDDINTQEISGHLAEYLRAPRIVNTKFVKPTNNRALPDGSNVEDFNKLSWNGSKYLWENKRPEMKHFYDSGVMDAAWTSRQYDPNNRAVVIYVHGMADRSDDLAIDIGCGLRYDGSILKGTQGIRSRHPEAGDNTGVVRADRKEMRNLQAALGKQINAIDPRSRVGIGEYKTAWSRSNGIQYHAGTNDASFQLEINRTLRNDPAKISRIIADSVRSVY